MRSLEVGCGRNRDPRCNHRVDANPHAFTTAELGPTHVVADAFTAGGLPWGDGYFDLVIAIDILEHAPYRATATALAEWTRVLKPGGRMYVQVPDAGRVMEAYVEDRERLRERLPGDLRGMPAIYGAAWRILGGQDDGVITQAGDDPYLNLHCAMFDGESLAWFLRKAGLWVESMESNPHPNLCAWALKS